MATKPIENQLPLGSTTFVDDDNQTMPGAETPTPSVATPPIADGGGGSTTKTTTTTVQGNPYGQFKGNNYEELEAFLKAQMDDYKPETKEEKEKREKKEKRRSFLANLADGLGTFHTTFAYARGDKPMDMVKMSPKLRELYEKQKAQRDKDKDRYVNYAIQLGKAKDADRDFNFRVTQAEQQQSNWREQFDAGRKDRADDVAFRQARADKADEQWQQQFDYTKEKDERNFNESVRQFNVSSSIQRQGLALQAQRLQLERENNSQIFTLGEGQGSVTVPRAAINSQNFSVIYNSLPKQYRTAQGDPIITKDALGNSVVSGYGAPSAEAMAIAVGAFLGDQNIPANQKNATRTALTQLGTKKGGNNKTMPGVK